MDSSKAQLPAPGTLGQDSKMTPALLTQTTLSTYQPAGTPALAESQLFTVSRGEYVSPDQKLLDLVYDSKSKKVDIEKAIKKIQGIKGNYSGIHYSVFFRADSLIELVDLGFYGPFTDSQAEYKVHIEVYKPRKDKQVYPVYGNARKIGAGLSTVKATHRTIFHVGFSGPPVWIQPKIWHMIQFKLDGPDTLTCTRTCGNVSAEASSSPDGKRQLVQFEFDAGGTKQLPCLRFRLP